MASGSRLTLDKELETRIVEGGRPRFWIKGGLTVERHAVLNRRRVSATHGGSHVDLPPYPSQGGKH